MTEEEKESLKSDMRDIWEAVKKWGPLNDPNNLCGPPESPLKVLYDKLKPRLSRKSEIHVQTPKETVKIQMVIMDWKQAYEDFRTRPKPKSKADLREDAKREAERRKEEEERNAEKARLARIEEEYYRRCRCYICDEQSAGPIIYTVRQSEFSGFQNGTPVYSGGEDAPNWGTSRNLTHCGVCKKWICGYDDTDHTVRDHGKYQPYLCKYCVELLLAEGLTYDQWYKRKTQGWFLNLLDRALEMRDRL